MGQGEALMGLGGATYGAGGGAYGADPHISSSPPPNAVGSFELQLLECLAFNLWLSRGEGGGPFWGRGGHFWG